MKFSAKSSEFVKVEADVIAVFAYLGQKSENIELSTEASKADLVLKGILSEIVKNEEFEAKPGSVLLMHTHGKIPAKRVLLVGVGKLSALSMFDWQSAGASIGRKSKEVKAERLAVVIPGEISEKFGAGKTAQGIVEGITLGTYTFKKHQSLETQKKDKVISEVWLLVPPARLAATVTGINRGEITSEAVDWARDLVNEPPSLTTPAYLGEMAKALGESRRGIKVEVLGKEEMQKLGMNALLAIARGSDEEPKFIKLDYDGGGRRTLCLVGKGITFDAGGLSLKKQESMETMKLDMAGAAAILGIFKALPVLKPKLRVIGLIAATENMPGSKAVKPGDIVQAMNGKTIEILNTDAEGRVILADALSYAGKKCKPDLIIDLATLTGACVVALGEEIIGLFSNDQKLATELKAAALATGEKIWEMPLAPEYQELLKSKVADFKNITGTRYGGAITAALLLREFVPPNTPWAHLDIAGPAFQEKDAPLTPYGGTGCGVRLILELLTRY